MHTVRAWQGCCAHRLHVIRGDAHAAQRREHVVHRTRVTIKEEDAHIAKLLRRNRLRAIPALRAARAVGARRWQARGRRRAGQLGRGAGLDHRGFLLAGCVVNGDCVRLYDARDDDDARAASDGCEERKSRPRGVVCHRDVAAAATHTFILWGSHDPFSCLSPANNMSLTPLSLPPPLPNSNSKPAAPTKGPVAVRRGAPRPQRAPA